MLVQWDSAVSESHFRRGFRMKRLKALRQAIEYALCIIDISSIFDSRARITKELSMPIPQKKIAEAPKSAKLRIYEELKKWIIDGTLQPGEKIYDSEIAQFFSVSRTPVREAIQLLADQKLIEVFPGKESRVSEIDLEDAGQSYQILAAFHSLAIEFAYPKITQETIEQLKQTNEKLSAAIYEGSQKSAIRYDQEFHDILLNLAANEFLISFSNTLESHIARIENLYYDKLPKQNDSAEGHEAIIKALENKDLNSAKAAVSQNWLHVLDALNKAGAARTDAPGSLPTMFLGIGDKTDSD